MSQAVDGIVQRLVGRSHPGDVAVGHAEYMAIHRFIRTGIFQIESDVDKHFVSLFGRLVFDCGGGDLRSTGDAVDGTVHIKGFFVVRQFVEVKVSVDDPESCDVA